MLKFYADCFYNDFSFPMKTSFIKRWLVSFVFISCFCLSMYAEERHALVLSLEECIQRAQCNSKAIEIAECQLLRAVSEKNIVRSAFFPQVDIEGVLDNRNDTLSGSLVQFQDFRSSHAIGFSARVGLWDFGSTQKRYQASKLRIDSSELNRDKALMDVEQAVRDVYFKILAGEKQVEIAQFSIHLLKKQLEKSTDMFDQGLVRHTDVLSVQVQLGEREKKFFQARNSLASHRMLLNQLLDLPIEESITLHNIEEFTYRISCEDAIAYALQQRPDLLSLQKQLDALYLERSALIIGVAPQIFAFANGNYSSEHVTALSAGLGLNFPLYRGGKRGAEIQTLDSHICEIQAQMKMSVDKTILDIKDLCLQFEEVKHSLYLERDALKLTERKFQDATELYQQELLAIHDVLEAEGQWSLAKLNYFSTLCRSQLLLAHFLNVTGGYRMFAQENL